MYQIVAVEIDKARTQRRWTVATGFKERSAACETLRRWIERHYRDALHDEDSALWLVRAFDEPQACYFIEWDDAATVRAEPGRGRLAFEDAR